MSSNGVNDLESVQSVSCISDVTTSKQQERGMVPYRCVYCGIGFKLIASLETHVKFAHQNLVETNTGTDKCIAKVESHSPILSPKTTPGTTVPMTPGGSLERNVQCSNKQQDIPGGNKCVGTLGGRSLLRISSTSNVLHKRVMYNCDYCSKIFNSHRFVRLHTKAVHKVAEGKALTFTSLETHVKFAHQNHIEIKTDKCNIKVESNSPPILTPKTSPGTTVSTIPGGSFERNVQCSDRLQDIPGGSKCVGTFGSRSQLRISSTANVLHKRVMYNCDYCSKIFNSQRFVRLHTKAVHKVSEGKMLTSSPPEVKPKISPIAESYKDSQECNETDTSKPIVSLDSITVKVEPKPSKSVRNRNSNAKKTECVCGNGNCGKKFGERQALMDHVISDHGGVNYRCSECDLHFTEKVILDKHTKLVHTPKKDNRTCNICGKVFLGSSTALKTHMRSIHEGIKYKCALCGKSFTQKGSLKVHILEIHERNQRFNCTECSKTFTQKGSMKMHVQSVHGGAEFVCLECGRSFTQKGNLKKHVECVHEGKTNFHCNICDRKFGEKGTLKTHIQSVHVGLRYLCKSCGKLFAQKGSLHSHMKTHTETVG